MWSGSALSKLHQIGCRWDPAGLASDHDHFAIDIIHDPIQWVWLMLREAWRITVGQKLRARDTFHGLAWVDVQCRLGNVDSFSP